MAKGERAQVSFGQTVEDLRLTGVECGLRKSLLIWASRDHCDTVTGGPWHEEVRGQSLEKGVVKSAQVVNGPSKGLLMKGGM